MLYPENPEIRARIDQRLYFDMGILYYRFSEYMSPQVHAGQPANPLLYSTLFEGLHFLNTFLEGQIFVAGDHLSIADLAIVSTISTYEASNIDFSQFCHIVRWYDMVKATAPGYDLNEAGLEIFKKYVADRIKK